ncbi:MAG TPA: hypothetical protein VGS58_10495 [Candidatus Sulfopaludibacter sp.]|nr:hypothetical protein [Candidatus Sulfopaludibacter sp.]
MNRAREQGYLDARRAGADRLLRPYSLWCWQLKLPVVWLEKRARYSRYARVRLDMFTTGDRLSVAGQFELEGLCAARPALSAHDAVWEGIPRAEAMALARAAMRVATRSVNREPNRQKRPAKVVRMAAPDLGHRSAAAS